MKKLFYSALILLFSTSLMAAPHDDARVKLQKNWAHFKYEVAADQREQMFKQLVDDSEAILKQYPDAADIMIWRAIILSTYAGEKGGLDALGLVKEAKKLLEQSIEIDPVALDGSAYTSLGSLYYQVPRWPIGFGNEKKAKAFLTKALEINPDGVDSNFFYGDFLIEQNDPVQAKQVLQHALQAKDRPGREIADRGRRAEIEVLLSKL